MAKDLTHVKVRSSVHIWQVLDGKCVSLTNEPLLLHFETNAGFDFAEFLETICKEYGFPRDDTPNGFLFVEHSSQRGNFILADDWNEEVERQLLRRGYIFVS